MLQAGALKGRQTSPALVCTAPGRRTRSKRGSLNVTTPGHERATVMRCSDCVPPRERPARRLSCTRAVASWACACNSCLLPAAPASASAPGGIRHIDRQGTSVRRCLATQIGYVAAGPHTCRVCELAVLSMASTADTNS